MSSSEFPKAKRRFDHGGFVLFARDGQRGLQWRCPNCGGDCFGTADDVRYCHGHSYGTHTEQSVPCGYWEDNFGNRGVQ